MASSRSRARLQTRRATRLRPTMTAPNARLDADTEGTARSMGRDTRSFGRASASRKVHGWSTRPGPRLQRQQRDWVSCGGALTGHLSAYGSVRVRVVRESVALPWHDERRAMGVLSVGSMISKGRQSTRRMPRLWSRDVAISVGGTDCVLAHSVTPLRASHGPWQAMRRLRTRPLAELLYDDSKVRRSFLVNRYLPASVHRDPLRRLLQAAGHPQPRSALVARRSVFERHGAPLLITECFLPAFWEMLDRSEALEHGAC